MALAAVLLLSMSGAEARKMLADAPAEAPMYGMEEGMAMQEGGMRRRLQEEAMAPGPGEQRLQPESQPEADSSYPVDARSLQLPHRLQ